VLRTKTLNLEQIQIIKMAGGRLKVRTRRGRRGQRARARATPPHNKPNRDDEFKKEECLLSPAERL
jgi:hypothetical protein